MMESQTLDTMLEIAKELDVEVIILRMDNKKFILEEASTYSYNWRKEELKWKNPFG
jgi:Zn-dependent peptidase ImmA (M78 family)